MDLTDYISGFFGIGSKASIREKQKDLLIRLLSYEVQTLTTEQKIQVLDNLGISVEDFGKGNKANYTKGTHEVVFSEPFTSPYFVILTASTATASVAAFVLNDSDLTKFTFKVPVDCTVRWSAHLITEA